MEWIKVEPGKTGEAARSAADALRRSGVVIFPAERLYGLAADAGNPEAIERVFSLKARDPEAPLSVIEADIKSAEKWVHASRLAQALIAKFWPGPLTLVLPLKRDLPRALLGNGEELGIRVPGSELAREIAAMLGRPITATSANRSGQGPGRTASEAAAGLPHGVDLVLDAGELPGPPGSTVVRVADSGLDLIRPGIIRIEDIEAEVSGAQGA